MRIYVDMDGVLCDFDSAHSHQKKAYPDVQYPQSVHGFWELLPEIPKAIRSIRHLAVFHEVYILTAPSIKNTICYSEKANWVKEHLGEEWLERLIICPDKSLLRGDVLIDDRLDSHGQSGFQGALIKHVDWDTTMRILDALGDS